ncbi:MAG: hypothetical protein LBH41_02060 [Rickettsiales bacterium]|jgi:hypothetical protein|nr:hypothetical protein [Rickettsiales bacterium]
MRFGMRLGAREAKKRHIARDQRRAFKTDLCQGLDISPPPTAAAGLEPAILAARAWAYGRAVNEVFDRVLAAGRQADGEFSRRIYDKG